MNETPLDTASPPPFSFHEDAAFTADMTRLSPDPKVRDQLRDHCEEAINRHLAGLEVKGHAIIEVGIESQLLVTEKTGIVPALRVVFSVTDEYPKRHINFHAAGLRDQNGGS